MNESLNRRNFLLFGGTVALAGAAGFTLAGCSSSTVIADLELVVAGVEAVFPAVAAATNLPPSVTGTISAYLAAVASASTQASDILAGAGSAVEKAARITALFASIAQPLLPPGTPQTVVGAISAVTQAVLRFLTNFSSAKVPASAAGSTPPKPVKVSAADSAKLVRIRERAVKAAAQAGAMRRQ